jgi:transcriptional regulator with XRE-family HTH domain
MSIPSEETKAVVVVVRGLRTEKRMTVQELAEASDISVSVISALESERHDPTLLELTSLARALGTNTENLLRQAGV